MVHRDPKDASTLWMHTGDEAIMDEEGYLRSESCPFYSLLIPHANFIFGSCGTDKGKCIIAMNH